MANKRGYRTLSDRYLLRMMKHGMLRVDLETSSIIGPLRKPLSSYQTGRNNKYAAVKIRHNRRYRTANVHRLVWMFATMNTIHPEFQIDHRDNDPSNNHISNLQLITKQENLDRRYQNEESYEFD
jgi:hypothetical protein